MASVLIRGREGGGKGENYGKFGSRVSACTADCYVRSAGLSCVVYGEAAEAAGRHKTTTTPDACDRERCSPNAGDTRSGKTVDEDRAAVCSDNDGRAAASRRPSQVWST